MTRSPGVSAMREVLDDLMELEEVTARLTERVTGTGIRYDLGDGDHPLLGRRLPDAPIGAGRLYDLMTAGQGLLLDPTGSLSVTGWARVDHAATDPSTLADLGDQAALVRPDGHLAWIGQDQASLDASLSTWFVRT